MMPEPELSDEELAFLRWQEENPDVWGDQDANGVDLARLRENLKLTPAERLQKHERARALVRRIKEAGERHRAANPGDTRLPGSGLGT